MLELAGRAQIARSPAAGAVSARLQGHSAALLCPNGQRHPTAVTAAPTAQAARCQAIGRPTAVVMAATAALALCRAIAPAPAIAVAADTGRVRRIAAKVLTAAAAITVAVAPSIAVAAEAAVPSTVVVAADPMAGAGAADLLAESLHAISQTRRSQ